MKKIYLILMAAIVALTTVSASATAFPPAPLKKATVANGPFQAIGTQVNTPEFKINHAPVLGKISTKATEIIETAPEGEVKYYNRAGSMYTLDSNYDLITSEQSGVLEVVFTDNNEVYIADILNIGMASYVKGTVEDGVITIQLPQTIYAGNGYNGELVWVDIDNSSSISGTVDTSTTTATFTIDGNNIYQDGSDETRVLGLGWDDDGSWGGYGIWNGEYTLAEDLPEAITPPEGLTPTTYYYNGTTVYSSAQHAFSQTVNVIRDGNDVYIQGLATGDADKAILPEAWAKGTLNGNTLTIPVGQFMGMYAGGMVYLAGYNTSTGVTEDVTFTYDPESDSYTLDNLMMVSPDYVNLYIFCYTLSGAVISAEPPVVPEVVEVPDGLETEQYTWTGYGVTYEDTDDDDSTDPEAVFTAFTKFIQVGFDGNDVYVQGLCTDLPEAWVKGTIEGNTATFATGQYFGVDDRLAAYGYTYEHYFVGFGAEGVCDVVFDYNTENKSFVTDTWIIDNEGVSEINYYLIFANNAWNYFVEQPGRPAEPSITSVNMTGTYPNIGLSIPLIDVTGYPMNPDKVYYRIFTDVDGDIQPLAFNQADYPRCEFPEETIYEIPYNMNDDYDIYTGGERVYLNQDKTFLNTVCRIGVQVVYYGGMTNEPAPFLDRSVLEVADNESEIVWYKIKNYTGIETVNASTVESVRYFNAAGLASDKPFNGINIVVKKMSDGSTVVTKVLK